MLNSSDPGRCPRAEVFKLIFKQQNTLKSGTYDKAKKQNKTKSLPVRQESRLTHFKKFYQKLK